MIDVPSGTATYAGNVSVIGTGNQLRVAATGGGTLNFTGIGHAPRLLRAQRGQHRPERLGLHLRQHRRCSAGRAAKSSWR